MVPEALDMLQYNNYKQVCKSQTNVSKQVVLSGKIEILPNDTIIWIKSYPIFFGETSGENLNTFQKQFNKEKTVPTINVYWSLYTIK